MVQAIDEYGTYTFVSHNYPFRKYEGVCPFIPYTGSDYKTIAVFNCVVSFTKKWFESNERFIKRVEDEIHNNLEIYNRNQYPPA